MVHSIRIWTEIGLSPLRAVAPPGCHPSLAPCRASSRRLRRRLVAPRLSTTWLPLQRQQRKSRSSWNSTLWRPTRTPQLSTIATTNRIAPRQEASNNSRTFDHGGRFFVRAQISNLAKEFMCLPRFPSKRTSVVSPLRFPLSRRLNFDAWIRPAFVGECLQSHRQFSNR